jgi:hypothetical protein
VSSSLDSTNNVWFIIHIRKLRSVSEMPHRTRNYAVDFCMAFWYQHWWHDGASEDEISLSGQYIPLVEGWSNCVRASLRYLPTINSHAINATKPAACSLSNNVNEENGQQNALDPDRHQSGRIYDGEARRLLFKKMASTVTGTADLMCTVLCF